MLRPSKKLALALEAVVDIAVNGATEPVQSQAIASRLGLPRRYLEQVMQQLVRAGVLTGVRGPRGGYRLARERRRVTVAEILRIVQGIDDQPVEASSSRIGREVIAPLFDRAAAEVLQRLEKVTIDDLCRTTEGSTMARTAEVAA